MKPADSLCTGRTALKRRRLLCALIGIMALVLQVFPLASAQASGSMWVEICGEFGAETVLLDVSAEDGAPVAPESCEDCCPCVLGGPVPMAVPQAAVVAVTAPGGAVRLYGAQDADVPQGAARFWPDTRGPPLWQSIPNSLDLPLMVPTRFSAGGAWS
ncbi:hypothetical protein QO034_09355 [Sedimentitalea sp. JM2-8]|uniref:DUF2946 domain-containing protein n=1 Tax=Sedimentitalea xiamensis TaxID=3050037 RepID=A0ABT7FDW1_9RHOB|nr:hypothetical protein [Sedimentitalea xiamensis]MDK3073314.1 hypothetical protein [Sedimentitalea xiamensis]